ncbi:hypothetical protein [Jiella sp. M17.18]|uniref:hypothetical protein n=1 Tax=Jiella sp. M17.18 TaxID=3234247 RepID=UPI0034DF14ED
MADSDTDPKMMRAQQDRDTPEHIARDETAPRREAGDTDAASAADRERALAGGTANSVDQMDAILGANRAGHGAQATAADEAEAEGEASGKAGLVRSGRSRLED